MSAQRVVVEVLDSHGRVRTRDRIELVPGQAGATLGRSAAADVIVDDPHAAGLHASIALAEDGTLRVTDLGSLNGIVVDGTRHRGGRDLPVPGGLLQVGRTRLRLRTAGETLAAEKPDHGITADLARNVPWVGFWTAALWIGLVVYSAWLEAPRDLPTVVASSLTYALAIAAAWVAVWALLTRVLQGEWRWATHAAIFFGVSAAAFLLDLLLDVGWFAFALPQFGLRESLLWTAGLVAVLYGHLANVSAARRRTLALFAVALPVLVVGSASWVQMRNQSRDVNYIDVREQIFPPALRIRAGTSTDEYFGAAAKLKQVADDKRKSTPSGDADAPDAAEE